MGVETFGVLAHPVQLAVTGAGGGDDAQILAAVEPGGGVAGDGEQGFPPVVVLAAGAGQGVARVELVPDGAVSVSGGVAFGLVPGELDEVAAAVGGDGLLEQGAGGGPQLVPAAERFAGVRRRFQGRGWAAYPWPSMTMPPWRAVRRRPGVARRGLSRGTSEAVKVRNRAPIAGHVANLGAHYLLKARYFSN